MPPPGGNPYGLELRSRHGKKAFSKESIPLKTAKNPVTPLHILMLKGLRLERPVTLPLHAVTMGYTLAFEAAALCEVRYTRYTVTYVDAQGFAT
jgi:hypothetical protein